jgi:cobyrinic acid a,c-diamide synthase
MVLGEGLVDEAGERHAMAGLLPLESSFAERRLHLGYRDVKTVADGPLGPSGSRFRGHEFHYVTILKEQGEAALFTARDASGRDLGSLGRRQGRVSGSFVHLIAAA